MKKKTKLVLATAFATAISVPAIAQAEKTGEQVFKQSGCISCHGADGKGILPSAPDFTAKDSRLLKSDSVLIDHITNGYRSEGNSGVSMPAYKGQLSPNEIKNAVKYLKQTFKK